MAPWWTRPQLDFPREEIQNREAILNSFEFVALEAGHQGRPLGGLGGLETGFPTLFELLCKNSGAPQSFLQTLGQEEKGGLGTATHDSYTAVQHRLTIIF